MVKFLPTIPTKLTCLIYNSPIQNSTEEKSAEAHRTHLIQEGYLHNTCIRVTLICMVALIENEKLYTVHSHEAVMQILQEDCGSHYKHLHNHTVKGMSNTANSFRLTKVSNITLKPHILWVIKYSGFRIIVAVFKSIIVWLRSLYSL